MDSLIKTLVGHASQKQQLVRMATEDRLPSSLIFVGPQGIGKAHLARALLQVINCQKAELSCGQCSSCVRSLEDRNERIIVLKPQGKRVIAVEQVREIQSELSLRLDEGVHRFILIDPADQLSQASANALLKVLEEPPPRTHFFLLTTNIGQLLPTLRSRSQTVHFYPLRAEELEAVEQLPAWTRRWAKGRWARAQRLASEDGETLFRESFELLGHLVQGDLRDWKRDFPWFFQSDTDRQFAMETWSEALRQRAFGQAEDLTFLTTNAGRLTDIQDEILNLQLDIEANVDKVLALDAFYYRLQESGKPETARLS